MIPQVIDWKVASTSLALVAFAAANGCKSTAPDSPKAAKSYARYGLVFKLADNVKRSLARHDLEQLSRPQTVTVFDPNYTKDKHFLALPLKPVLKSVFKLSDAELGSIGVVFRCADGYVATIPGKAIVAANGPLLAVEDLDYPKWEAIGPQRVPAGPYYLIWSQEAQQDTKRYPWPWQVLSVEVADLSQRYALTKPPAPWDTPQALAGHTAFTKLCIRCHAINRQGGRLGPDLNVPQNITEYRPEPQIRAFILNPQAFRYGNMPANPQLSTTQVDQLLAYLRAIKNLKRP